MVNMRFFCIFFVLTIFSSAHAATTIDAQVVRNQTGSGSTLISSGFPCPPGLVTENLIVERKIKVLVGGAEVAANVSALRGRHSDGTVRSALIQFTVDSMAQGDVLAAQVVVDGGVRVNGDPAYIRPVWSMVTNNNAILPTSSAYLTSTRIIFQNLLPAGQGTSAEEKQYTELAELKFDALVANPSEGGATYENVRAMLTLWARTGNKKYFNHAITYTQEWIRYNTPTNGLSCTNTPYINPDGRTNGTNGSCGAPNEAGGPRSLSFASLYLLTGYRDFWGYIAYRVQYNQAHYVTDQATANTNVIPISSFGLPRFHYVERYEALLAAYYVDATVPAAVPWRDSRVLNFQDQFTWTINAIKEQEWDFRWIPFSGGAGTVPARYTTTISQGGVSATLLGVFPIQKFDPQRNYGKAMPTTGYLMVRDVTGGSFAAGALTGISATATGPDEADYRQGLTGLRAESPRLPNTSTLTGSISGTTLTVTSTNSSSYPILVGSNLYASGIPEGMFIVSQDSGTTGGVGTYTISESTTASSRSIYWETTIPTFQMVFTTNFLIDYYLNVYADSRIPAMVKKNLDVLLAQFRQLESGSDVIYGDEYWGYTAYGKSYRLQNPPLAYGASSYENPEYPRFIAFVLKTLGSDTVNGATYETWYARLVDAANNSPYSGLLWEWKLFGQFYGFGADAPWMMAQSSLPGSPGFRAPTNYVAIPGDAPDIVGNTPRRLSLAGRPIKLVEPGP